MGFKKFSTLLALRFFLILVTLAALAFYFTAHGYLATTILLAIILIAQLSEVLRFISRTNAELVRFFEAARYADFSQRFELNALGSGFGELGNLFGEILNRFEAASADQHKQLQHMKALVEQVPVPLISVYDSQKLTLWNNSARRMFGAHAVYRVSDLEQFGTEFGNVIRSIQPGQRHLVNFSIDGMQQQLAISATQIVLAGNQETLISMHNIQSELDIAQLHAWRDLVRVLTHEILNSVTPVASLASTALDLLNDIREKNQNEAELLTELENVSDALTTVARRSEGLTRFVGSFRQLTRLPSPNKKLLRITNVLEEVTKLATQKWQENGIKFIAKIEPRDLEVFADMDLLVQILINLLNNAEQALSKINNPMVIVQAALHPRGHVVISVGDNGDGVAQDIAEKVFVPFFTTKRDGSGVGLALTRQIMVMHGGNVRLGQNELGGAQFDLIF